MKSGIDYQSMNMERIKIQNLIHSQRSPSLVEWQPHSSPAQPTQRVCSFMQPHMRSDLALHACTSEASKHAEIRTLQEIEAIRFDDSTRFDLNRKSSMGLQTENAAGAGGSQRRSRKRLWSLSEDELLCDLVQKHGAQNWIMLSRHFPSRSAMQLRARWAHTLSNPNSKRPFTAAEDAFILSSHSKYGNAWSLIASRMDDRLGNRVKNRFTALTKQR